MLRVRTTLTRKGQVTVPVEIRRALGLREGDKVEFTMEDGRAVLQPAGSVVERTAGMLKADVPPMTERQLKEAAEQAIADDAYERMNR